MVRGRPTRKPKPKLPTSLSTLRRSAIGATIRDTLRQIVARKPAVSLGLPVRLRPALVLLRAQNNKRVRNPRVRARAKAR